MNLNDNKFYVYIIATMSAGKSTLINALLARKLMPSKQEACTAIITKIKNCDLEDFRAVAYDKNGNIIEEVPTLTYEVMQRLNENKEVFEIDVEGKIPFVSSKDISLVLVDTPGPNNSRDEGHKAATYRMIDQSSKTLVLYILNASQFAVNDDNALLSDVAASMSVGGKQSKDRFIFVVNKLADFRMGEDNVESTLKKVRDYLEKHGIHDPNIFPASALTALNIRTILSGVDLKSFDPDSDDDTYEAVGKIRKFNRNAGLHLETFATLTPSLQREIRETLERAKKEKDAKTEALVHSGIISIEAVIKAHVEEEILPAQNHEENPNLQPVKDYHRGDKNMIEVFIKYNPYKLETEVKINNEHVKDNSPFREIAGKEKRLQEWIENLPAMLREECNDRDYHVVFHGITPDFEDLQFIAENAKKDGFNITCEHIPATETEDKEPVIRQIFEDIQKGPFDELRQPDLISSFESASSDNFPVNVIATMSAGKSTLINALLARKLMPSKQEACTAIITKIKNCDLEDFRAVAYDKNGNIIEEVPTLTYEVMQRLNENKEVFEIDVEGKIPFVSSKDISLVLVDTPGPNNSRDEGHKAATYRMIDQSSKTLVLYILNASQFAVNDDNALLSDVAASMSVGGKQSKDRFIFVVNKLADFRMGEDNVESTLKKVRDYLEKHGIHDPNIFPASALTALNIRTILSGVDLKSFDPDSADDDTYEAVGKIRKLNRNSGLHLERYATMTPSLQREIDGTLERARSEKDSKTEALVHTGIIPIEAAIRIYVEKYARTAKIKNIVNTFRKKLESTEALEKLKKEIVSGQERSQEIQKKIDVINKKLHDGREARKFQEEVSRIDYTQDTEAMSKSIRREIQDEITNRLELSRVKVEKTQAESFCDGLARFAETLQAKFVVKLEKGISEHVQKTARAYLEAYKQKLANLIEDLKVGDIELSPLEIMEGTLDFYDFEELIRDFTEKERVQTGRHWKENEDKHWWNPFTWFDDSGWWVNDYKDVEYVMGEVLAQKFFSRLEDGFEVNIEAAKNYAVQQAKVVNDAFEKKFKELDEALQKKLNELSAYSKDQSDTEQAIRESEDRLRWLEEIRKRVDAILEI